MTIIFSRGWSFWVCWIIFARIRMVEMHIARLSNKNFRESFESCGYSFM